MIKRTMPIACALMLAVAAGAQAGPPRDLGRETIAPGDGWAALPTADLPQGTTGGSAASPSRVHVVRDRNELVAALSYPDATPKIVKVIGTIDANVDAAGNPLTCDDYARPDPQTGELYSVAAFLDAYDPQTWGRVPPSGPQERARAASAAAQQARVRVRIPANTTIVGKGDARVLGAWFDIRPGTTSGSHPMNVIIRNLRFEDTFDCFPQWSPTDGAQGNWNSLYDSISVRNSTHVWIDHNSFRDIETADERMPTYFGRLFQVHDGFIDITNESDLVTVSWNHLADHDKAMLIGSSDGATADRGKLRVTLHHNWFDNLGQRAPRVRFGQVHVYNNLYTLDAGAVAARYGYSWGVGIESAIVAEGNHFLVPEAVTEDLFIDRFNGVRIHAADTRRNRRTVDPVAAWNRENGDLLQDAVDWTPILYRRIDPSAAVPALVPRGAGPLPIH